MMKVLEVRDTNKDGFISRDDLELIIKRYKDLGVSDQHLEKLKKNMEQICENLGITDPKTKLTYEEVLTNSLKGSGNFEETEKAFLAHFDLVDTDGNGVISYNEWEDLYRVTDIGIKHARSSFEAMDANGDGVVSKEEYLAFTKEFYFTTDDKLKSSIMYGPLD